MCTRQQQQKQRQAKQPPRFRPVRRRRPTRRRPRPATMADAAAPPPPLTYDVSTLVADDFFGYTPSVAPGAVALALFVVAAGAVGWATRRRRPISSYMHTVTCVGVGWVDVGAGWSRACVLASLRRGWVGWGRANWAGGAPAATAAQPLLTPLAPHPPHSLAASPACWRLLAMPLSCTCWHRMARPTSM